MSAFDLNELKEKVSELAATAAGKAKDLASATAEQTKRLSRIAKLNLEISTERDNVKKSYIEIGKLYYETHKDAPEGFFAQLCEEVTACNALIDEKEAELESLKASVSDTDEPIFDPDFETVVSETEAAAEPEAEPEAEPKAAEEKPEE